MTHKLGLLALKKFKGLTKITNIFDLHHVQIVKTFESKVLNYAIWNVEEFSFEDAE